MLETQLTKIWLVTPVNCFIALRVPASDFHGYRIVCIGLRCDSSQQVSARLKSLEKRFTSAHYVKIEAYSRHCRSRICGRPLTAGIGHSYCTQDCE